MSVCNNAADAIKFLNLKAVCSCRGECFSMSFVCSHGNGTFRGNEALPLPHRAGRQKKRCWACATTASLGEHFAELCSQSWLNINRTLFRALTKEYRLHPCSLYSLDACVYGNNNYFHYVVIKSHFADNPWILSVNRARSQRLHASAMTSHTRTHTFLTTEKINLDLQAYSEGKKKNKD